MEILSRIDLPKLLIHFGLPLIGVEIGVAGGSNAADLLRCGLEKIYCVDNWRTFGERGDMAYPQDFHDANFKMALKNLSKYNRERYVILRGKSAEMCKHIPDNSLGLVYIDGDHSYDGCKQDIENYYPKLVAGGIVGLHDYMNEAYGIRVAVLEFIIRNNLTIHYIPETGVGDAGCWFQKT